MIGYNYLADFETYESGQSLKVERVASDLLNFRKLLAGRIDVYPASLESGYAILRAHFSDAEVEQFAYVPQMPDSYAGTSFHLMLGKSYPDAEYLMERFNQGLQELKASGAYDQYFEEARAGLYRQKALQAE